MPGPAFRKYELVEGDMKTGGPGAGACTGTWKVVADVPRKERQFDKDQSDKGMQDGLDDIHAGNGMEKSHSHIPDIATYPGMSGAVSLGLLLLLTGNCIIRAGPDNTIPRLKKRRTR
jgi:hypothetical protein